MSTLLLHDYYGPHRLVRLDDGEWRLRWPEPESVTDDTSSVQRDGWASIEVPGCWTMQGFDKPQYTNVQMPFPGPHRRCPATTRPASTDARVRARGLERRTHRAARRAARDGALRVHRRRTRRHGQGLAPPPGVRHHDARHRRRAVDLALVVVRWSDATYLEDQDHWHHAGLHRSVFSTQRRRSTLPTCTP